MKKDVMSELPAAAAAEGAKVIPLGFKLTDLGNSERLVARFRDRIRYCPTRKKWLTYDSKRWAWDETGELVRLGKTTVRGIYEECSVCHDDEVRKATAKHAKDSEKAARVQAMITLAQSEPGIPVLLHELDADPWLLNANNGTIDLHTGKLRQHNRGELITKTTGVDYSPDATSELWDRVLHDATGGDVELASYLQRVAGYSLIGEPLERAFFFLFGPPGTAKSTLVEALHTALGDYVHSAAFETWLVQANVGGNRGDLVRLFGARLVTSVEVRAGARWDEALIKRITGGDEIVAAAKFEAEVSFRPGFTLLLAANDAPSAREDDAGLWARLRRIPLTAQIPPARQDPTIKTKLRQPEHAAAVLAWAVAGCLAYQRGGLGSCSAVEVSTNAYRAENDQWSEYLEDCCVLDPTGRVTRAELRESYERWGKETGRRKLLTAKEIASRLREKGCQDVKVKGTLYWEGIRLRDGSEPERGAAEAQGAAGGTSHREVPIEIPYEEGLGNAAPSCPLLPPRPEGWSIRKKLEVPT